MKHKAFVCNCYSGCCQYCDGGLFCCTQCGSAEGASTTECPGHKLSYETLQAVYNGLFDFRKGRWVVGNGDMPCHTRKIQIKS